MQKRVMPKEVVLELERLEIALILSNYAIEIGKEKISKEENEMSLLTAKVVKDIVQYTITIEKDKQVTKLAKRVLKLINKEIKLRKAIV